MSDKDDIVDALAHASRVMAKGVAGVRHVFGEQDADVIKGNKTIAGLEKALTRIQLDAARIAELEAEVDRLKDDLHAEQGFTEILMSEREPTP